MSELLEAAACSAVFASLGGLRRFGEPLDVQDIAERAAGEITQIFRGSPAPSRRPAEVLRQRWRSIGSEMCPLNALTSLGSRLAGARSPAPSHENYLRRRLPPELVEAARAVSQSHVSTGQRKGNREPLVLGDFADGHVHLGTAVPMSWLFFIGCARGRLPAPAESWDFFSTSSSQYRPDVLLFAAGLALRSLTAYVRDTGVTHPDFGTHLRYSDNSNEYVSRMMGRAGGSQPFWDLVSDQLHSNVLDLATWDAVAGRPSTESDESAAAKLGLGIIASNPRSVVLDLLTALIQKHYAVPHDSLYCGHLSQVLRCLAVFHSSMTPGVRAGLDSFVEHFQMQRRARDLARVGGREALVRTGLEYLAADDGARRIELRTSVDAPTIGRFEESHIAAQLMPALRGYRHYLTDHNSEPAPVVRFPVSLLRQRPTVEDDRATASPTNWDASSLWKTIGALAGFYASSESARQFFGVVDVAGDEEVFSNWLFTSALEELIVRVGNRLSGDWLPVVTYHMGESFAYPLQGLRRMAEVFDHVPELRRAGHGLALSTTSRHSRELVDRLELLDDLTWAWSATSAVGDSSIQAALRGAAEDLVPMVFPGLRASVVDAWAAQKMRFSRSDLVGAGYLAWTDHRAKDETAYDGEIRRSDVSSRGVRWQMFTRYLSHGEVDHGMIEVEPYQDLLADTFGRLLPNYWRRAVDRGIIFEYCPSSNIAIAGLDDYRNHPFFDLAPPGLGRLRVTINSDNPGLFHVRVPDEFRSLAAVAHDEEAVSLEAARTLGLEAFGGDIAPGQVFASTATALRALELLSRY